VGSLADAMALPLIDRERLFAAVGYRSEAWDDPLVAELVEVLADPAIPAEIQEEVRGVVRVAVRYAKMATLRQQP